MRPMPQKLKALNTGSCAVMPREQTSAAGSTTSFEDLQSTWDRSLLVCSPTGARTRWIGLLQEYVRGREQWRVFGTPRGHKAPQDRQGRYRHDVQGAFGQLPARPLPNASFQPAVMSGDHHMETLVPRQHLALAGSSYIRRFTLLPHSH